MILENSQSPLAPKRALAFFIATMIALGPNATPAVAATGTPATPIQHLVVIFNENISFDHYFGTYPIATNPPGEPKFTAVKGTPNVNGLTNALLTLNPNLNPANGPAAANPFRLDRSQAVTGDQDHGYTDEQAAFDSGLMDLFPAHGGFGSSQVMGYFDGNTVTGLWNYAQHFAMSDNSYGTTFGPSTPGLLNLVSGQTNGVTKTLNGTSNEVSGGPDGSLSVIGDPDPIGDVCSNSTRNQVQMGGKNIGDLLTAAGVTWGGFMGDSTSRP
jgi:phospholipase C